MEELKLSLLYFFVFFVFVNHSLRSHSLRYKLSWVSVPFENICGRKKRRDGGQGQGREEVGGVPHNWAASTFFLHTRSLPTLHLPQTPHHILPLSFPSTFLTLAPRSNTLPLRSNQQRSNFTNKSPCTLELKVLISGAVELIVVPTRVHRSYTLLFQ